MKFSIENNKYDTKMTLSDFRYSAGVLGLIKYFDYYSIDYEQGYDYILYNQDSITKEKYLLYAEYYFKDRMHHVFVEDIINQENFTDRTLEEINKKLNNTNNQSNTVMKKIFGGKQYTVTDMPFVLKTINENRLEIIEKTYLNGKNTYSKYCNINSFFNNRNKICRVIGYYVDIGRKTKTLSYNFDNNTYVYNDELEFDFIPFAFTKTYESYLINNNTSIEKLCSSNAILSNKEDKKPKESLFKHHDKYSNYLLYDVEVIIKKMDNEYFETKFIRKDCMKIFKRLSEPEYSSIQYAIKINDNYYINIEDEVINKILNMAHLDNIIELLLKKNYNTYSIKTLIKINNLIYGGENMDIKLKASYAAGKQVASKLEKNKLNSFRNKLLSAITFKDYDKFCEILLKLSDYSDVTFGFAYDLFDDFENNKNVAYTFINALSNNFTNENKEEK